MDVTRWGILGPGAIAEKFAAELSFVPDATLAAVGSRSGAKAKEFAGRFAIPRAHGSYAELANDPEIDIVYIATPHPAHHPCARLCLEAGKAVVCEKPFTVNAAQASDLIELAHERNLFLMEAMWTRFLPLFRRLRELLAAGVIGEPRLLTADFGFRHGGGPTHRLFAPALAGGALLDIGVYVCSLASMVFGRPDRITGLATFGETGVDELSAITLGYDSGAIAQLSVSIRVNTPQEATLIGTEGHIRIPPVWWKGTELVVGRPGRPDERIEAPIYGNGYNYEAAEAMRCLRSGLTESPIMPPGETLEIMETLDAIRAQWGLRYPFE